jgi:hypothetical protein
VLAVSQQAALLSSEDEPGDHRKKNGVNILIHLSIVLIQDFKLQIYNKQKTIALRRVCSSEKLLILVIRAYQIRKFQNTAFASQNYYISYILYDEDTVS